MKNLLFFTFLIFTACEDGGQAPHQCLDQSNDVDNDGVCDDVDDCIGTYDCLGVCDDSPSVDVNRTFNIDILPLFEQYGCVNCHSENGSGGLDLSNYASAVEGGDSGNGFVSNDLNASWIWKRIDDCSMPPDNSGDSKVSGEDIKIIEDWIEQGVPNE